MIGINTFTLKILAIVSMFIDHIGAVFFPKYMIFRIIGRLAFPIFAYTLVEGFCHTHDIRKYMKRVGALAILSEIPFDLAFFGVPLEFSHQNVFFTLFMGLLMLYLMIQTMSRFRQFLIVLGMFLLSEYLHTDYSSMGLFMIFLFYQLREQKGLKLVSVALVNIFLMGYSQVYAALAMIPISFHNGKQGPKMKWFFYGFYPIHLLVLYVIHLIL